MTAVNPPDALDKFFRDNDPPVEATLRKWAQAYRDHPEHRFPSDPDAEFFPQDLEAAATEIDRLRAAQAKYADSLVQVVEGVVGYLKAQDPWQPLTQETPR